MLAFNGDDFLRGQLHHMSFGMTGRPSGQTMKMFALHVNLPYVQRFSEYPPESQNLLPVIYIRVLGSMPRNVQSRTKHLLIGQDETHSNSRLSRRPCTFCGCTVCCLGPMYAIFASIDTKLTSVSVCRWWYWLDWPYDMRNWISMYGVKRVLLPVSSVCVYSFRPII